MKTCGECHGEGWFRCDRGCHEQECEACDGYGKFEETKAEEIARLRAELAGRDE